MIPTRIRSAAVHLTTGLALAVMAGSLVAAPSADAAGLRNCVDVTGRQVGRVGCYENVWADDIEVRMTFSNQHFTGAKPGELDPFYVVAPQSATPQGPMAGFPHDHVVRSVPRQNHGTNSVQLQGFFVLCTGQGLTSGSCDAAWIAPGGDPLPFAISVDGRPLTSTEAIEAAAADGNLALVDLGPGAVIVGTVTGAAR
jgi:hypothetical protein